MQDHWEQLHARLTSVFGGESPDQQLWQDIEELSFESAQGIIWRAEMLTAQLVEMQARKKVAIFFTPLRDSTDAPGRCWLCGEDLPASEPGEHFRCSSCAMAARLVLWRTIRINGAPVQGSANAAALPTHTETGRQLL